MMSIDKVIPSLKRSIIAGGILMLTSSLGSLLFLLTVFPLNEAMSDPNSLFAFITSQRVKLLLPMTLFSIAFDKSSSLGHINICCKSRTFSAQL